MSMQSSFLIIQPDPSNGKKLILNDRWELIQECHLFFFFLILFNVWMIMQNENKYIRSGLKRFLIIYVPTRLRTYLRVL